MSKLKIHPTRDTGRIVHVTPESAGWKHVGFDIWKLKPGGVAEGGEPGREVRRPRGGQGGDVVPDVGPGGHRGRPRLAGDGGGPDTQRRLIRCVAASRQARSYRFCSVC